MNELDDDMVKDFLVECYENLNQLDRDLVALEKDPSSTDILARVFRTVHTVKGSSSFLGLSKLESVAHSCESLLSPLRDREIDFTPQITSALLATVDAIRRMLSNVETSQNEGNEDYADLIETLASLKHGAVVSATEEKIAQTKPTTLSATDLTKAKISESKIRVDVGLLDKLMNLAGELVLARNQILQFASTQEDTGFLGASQSLSLITSELQEGIMKIRMQPISNIWNKFPRVVRDLAAEQGKQVRLEMKGEKTELDRTINEAINDPLTHLVRNVVDHAIEMPEERVASGKPAEGRLLLRAFHEGGQVNIEISDDGAGIDPGFIKKHALEKGIITPEEAVHLSDNKAANLIFLSGFSTARKVTNISGRGVGMDVVKTNIEKIGGTVDIQSNPGQGTTFRIKIPLTLAIIPALIVTSSEERYAIPQVSLVELVRLEGGQNSGGIEMVHGAPVYRLRSHLLPLVYLNQELQKKQKMPGLGSEKIQEEVVNIVVLQADYRQFGLVVDSISDTHEIVVKALGKQLRGISVFSGATILGDGRVALILDVLHLAKRASVILTSEEREKALTPKEEDVKETLEERQKILLFQGPNNVRMAIALSMVARLEEFSVSAIEKAGGQDVIQYRNQILPLIYLSALLFDGGGETRRPRDDDSTREQDTIHVVVYVENGRSVGLVVDRIIDILEESITTKTPATRKGILFSTVIQSRVTEFLDMEGVIRSANPYFFERTAAD